MSSKILTHSVTSIDDFIRDPFGALNTTQNGIIAIFVDNEPRFYAITPERLERLLNLEAHLIPPSSGVTLDIQLFEKAPSLAAIPIGKFPMYSNWHPGEDFQRQAALWGISLTKPITKEELAAFISWWQEEKKIFTHIQWQQKLARSVQIIRARKGGDQMRRDMNTFSQSDAQIPHGFRGVK